MVKLWAVGALEWIAVASMNEWNDWIFCLVLTDKRHLPNFSACSAWRLARSPSCTHCVRSAVGWLGAWSFCYPFLLLTVESPYSDPILNILLCTTPRKIFIIFFAIWYDCLQFCLWGDLNRWFCRYRFRLLDLFNGCIGFSAVVHMDTNTIRI